MGARHQAQLSFPPPAANLPTYGSSAGRGDAALPGALQISFTTVLCKVPGLMLMKKKTVSEHFPPPSSRARSSGFAALPVLECSRSVPGERGQPQRLPGRRQQE